MTYTCPKCKTPVGQLVELDGIIWLNTDGWLVSDARKFCHACGYRIHFKRPKKELEQISGGLVMVMGVKA